MTILSNQYLLKFSMNYKELREFTGELDGLAACEISSYSDKPFLRRRFFGVYSTIQDGGKSRSTEISKNAGSGHYNLTNNSNSKVEQLKLTVFSIFSVKWKVANTNNNNNKNNPSKNNRLPAFSIGSLMKLILVIFKMA